MTNVQAPMTKNVPKTQYPKRKAFDLCERTERFGEAVIGFAKGLPVTSITKPLIEQLIRAGTSVGANYCEADDASTKKEFIYKLSICLREVKEFSFWLKMIIKAVPSETVGDLIREAQELRLIFSSIINNSKR